MVSNTLRVGLLGSLTAVDDDRVLSPPPSASQRRLLSILALEADHVLSIGRLCDLLACAPGSLRTTTSRLRAGLGAEHLSTEPPGYVLHATTDAAHFVRLVTDAATLDGNRAIDVLDEALALWRGDALEEFRDEAWAVHEVARLDEHRAAAIELRADHLVACGHLEAAIADLRSHVGRHPLRERPHAILMRALAADGRTVEALRVYQDHRHFLVTETGTEPSDALRDLERSLARGPDRKDPGHDVEEVRRRNGPAPTNLPAPRTSLVGRSTLVHEVGELTGEHRLVTLIGPGGVGKTRLAIEVARTVRASFPDGVHFVDLTRATDPDDVEEVVRSATRAKGARPRSPDEELVDLVRPWTALLVFDNCEHVIDRVADVVDDVLTAAEDVCILATSREPLRLHGERILIVPSLGVTGPDSDGMRLFRDRVRAAGSTTIDDPLDEALDQGTAQEIVRRLDGIPLAIELAAARTATLPLDTILDLLDDRFDLLAQRLRRVPQRHQTLRATVEWSYDLLSDEERRAFRRLSACAGTFSTSTAARLLDRPESEAIAVLDGLRDKSLIVAALGGDDLLETLREFGREETDVAGETRTVAVALERALMPDEDVRSDWTTIVNRYMCAADPRTMVEDTTRLAAATTALDAGRLDHAALIFGSVAFRDEPGALRARAGLVAPLAARRDDLDPLAWRVANAAALLLDRAARDYGSAHRTATAMEAALDLDDPARTWFTLWICAFTTAVAPEAGLALNEASLPAARRSAEPPLDWTLSQFLGLRAVGLAMTGDLEQAAGVADEALAWAPDGQESRDQILALQAWFGYLRGVPMDPQLAADLAGQPHDLGLAELCGAPGVLHGSGDVRARAARMVGLARSRPSLDIAAPFLLAFAWLAIEAGELDRARHLLAHAELYDSSTQVALVHAWAAIEGWTGEAWNEGRDRVVSSYLAPKHEEVARIGGRVLDEEVRRWADELTGVRRSGG